MGMHTVCEYERNFKSSLNTDNEYQICRHPVLRAYISRDMEYWERDKSRDKELGKEYWSYCERPTSILSREVISTFQVHYIYEYVYKIRICMLLILLRQTRYLCLFGWIIFLYGYNEG